MQSEWLVTAMRPFRVETLPPLPCVGFDDTTTALSSDSCHSMVKMKDHIQLWRGNASLYELLD